MKPFLLILFLLLLPARALAQQPTYDLSCHNVAKVTIVRETADDFSETRARGGHFYVVFFRLKPEAVDRFQPILNASRKIIDQNVASGAYSRKGLFVTAHGLPLRNDIPEINAHSGRTVNTYLFREKDAQDVAHSVCPTAPIELIVPPKPPGLGQDK